MLTDREILRQTEKLFERKPDVPFQKDFDPLISALSFTKCVLNISDAQILRTAWSGFLEESLGYTDWDWPCSEGIAQWYLSRDMPAHAISVYEHLYSRIRQGDLLKNPETYQDFLLRLFDLYVEHKIADRARHIGYAIQDYYEDGTINLDPVSYAEFFAIHGQLRYTELGGLIDEDRHVVESRLQQDFPSIFEALHVLTKKLLVDAEVWSHPRIRRMEPTSSPRYWTLAVENEFHFKVFQSNREIIAKALNKPPGDRRVCSPGQILFLLRRSGTDPGLRTFFSTLHGGDDFATNHEAGLEAIDKDRDKWAHSRKGLYTLTDCNNFLHTVRESGWVFRFLSDIQPLNS